MDIHSSADQAFINTPSTTPPQCTIYEWCGHDHRLQVETELQDAKRRSTLALCELEKSILADLPLACPISAGLHPR